MKIQGANLGNQEGEYNLLSNYNWTNDGKINKLILMVENLYLRVRESAKRNICPIPRAEFGKVQIEKGMVNHRCSADMDTLRGISEYGILASEWFGILESGLEACFCVFVSRMKGNSYPMKGDLGEDDYSRLNNGQNIILFLDDSNELMKYLIHLDYFEFEFIKNKYLDKIKDLYSKEEIDIFENLIEQMSPAGKDMRMSYDDKNNYWSAIPGGIPSFLINGICIKKNEYTAEELNEINNLFPNATIFNNNREVIREPLGGLDQANNKKL